jgi:fructuronate reductase
MRLLASIADNLDAGRPAPCTILAVAAWICCASGRVGRCHAVAIEDADGERMRRIGDAVGDDAERLTAAALDLDAIFGTELPRHAPFRGELARAVGLLQREGARGAVAALMASPRAVPPSMPVAA